jgi:hypothetical protein
MIDGNYVKECGLAEVYVKRHREDKIDETDGRNAHSTGKRAGCIRRVERRRLVSRAKLNL